MSRSLPGRQLEERHSKKVDTDMQKPKEMKMTRCFMSSKSSYGWIRGGVEVIREGSGMLGRDQVKEGMPCWYVGTLSCRQRGETCSDLHFTKTLRWHPENELEGPKPGLRDLVCRQLQ